MKEIKKISIEFKSLNDSWIKFNDLKTLNDIEYFLNYTDIGESINFIELKNLFNENNIIFEYNKVKSYLQIFFINKSHQIIQKFISYNKNLNINNEKEALSLLENSIYLTKLIRLYLVDETLALEEIKNKEINFNISVNFYIDKICKKFMLDCFFLFKKFVN